MNSHFSLELTRITIWMDGCRDLHITCMNVSFHINHHLHKRKTLFTLACANYTTDLFKQIVQYSRVSSTFSANS